MIALRAQQLALDRQYSLSDRIRYYWPVPAVQAALDKLLNNLEENPPPLTLLSQYLPRQYEQVRAGNLRPRARDLVLAIVLFPLLSPVLVCGVVGTRKAFELQPFESYSGFLGLMAMSTAITLALGVGLFGALVDD